MSTGSDITKQVQSDMGKLRAVIRALDSIGRLDDREEGHLRAFTSMLEEMVTGKRTKLTENQRGYLKGVYERVMPRVQRVAQNDSTQEVVHLVPDVLRNLPKRPPTRIAK